MTTTELTHYAMHIDGELVDTEESMTIHSPATGSPIATVAKGTATHIDAAVAAGKAAFEKQIWAGKTQQERASIMRAIAAAANDAIEELVELEMSANGATVRQATGFHVGYALAHFDFFADLADTYEFSRPAPIVTFPALAQSVVHREPLGVVGAIAPWNFPLLLTLWKVGPALAAGNSVVVKPDEHTPLSMLRFVEIAEANGLPKGVLNVVPGTGRDAGARLASHPDVAKIAFTGSTQIGREIMRLASGTVKDVTLELGGKGPSIVLDDADLEMAVDGVLYGCFTYSGQICESGTRAIVPRSLHDEFVSRLVQRAETIVVGAPDDWGTDMGPVIDGKQQASILRFINEAVEDGAEVAIGGGVPVGEEFGTGYWVAPTILTKVDNSMRIAREEVFGPVLVVIPYDSEDEAVAIANDSDYGLAASVWSSDNARALDVARRVQSGSVWINDAHQINAQVPFGGYKQSGIGRELGPDALDEYTQAKAVHVDLSGGREAKPYDVLLSHADD